MQNQQSKELGELVSYKYKCTCKHTLCGCLNKIMLKKGDMSTEMSLRATACSNMLSGKNRHIFVSSRVYIIIFGAEGGKLSCCGI